MKTMMFDQNVQHFIDFPLGKRKGNPLGKRKGIFSDFSDFRKKYPFFFKIFFRPQKNKKFRWDFFKSSSPVLGESF